MSSNNKEKKGKKFKNSYNKTKRKKMSLLIA
jgi:hypothetical protein